MNETEIRGPGVYKSEAGRELVENEYRRILDSFSGVPHRSEFARTIAGKTHVLRFDDAAGDRPRAGSADRAAGRSRPPVLMLHGSMSNSATWFGCAGDFMDMFSLYCVDIPGEPGLSEPVRLPLASGKPAEWLRSLLDDLGIEKCAIVGMSLGSWYALRFASAYPERVSALSLITTSGIAPQRMGFILKVVILMMLGKWGRERLNREIYHKTPIPPKVGEFQELVSLHFRPLTEALPLFTDDELSRLSMPLQYFGGDHDVFNDSRGTAERLRRLVPRAETNVLVDTGHVIIDRFPAVKQFLAETAG